MNRVYSKSAVTRAVLERLVHDGSTAVGTHDACMSNWWVTRRSARGLQLTRAGVAAFSAAAIDYEDRVLDTGLRGELWTIDRLLNRALPCPHSVEHNTRLLPHRHAVVRLYDARLAVWIDMSGTLNDYIAKWESRLTK